MTHTASTSSDKSFPKPTAPSQPEPSTSDTVDHSIATAKDFSEHSEGHSTAAVNALRDRLVEQLRLFERL
eukprot:4069937-Prymnesium_polylepis.1